MRLIIGHDGKRQRSLVPDGSSVQDILGFLLERFQVTSNADSFRLLTSDKVEIHPADIVSGVCDNDEVICLSAMVVAKPASTKQPTRSAAKGSAQKVLRDPRLEMMRAAQQVQLDRRGHHRRAASVARFTPRMSGACAGERRKFDLNGVGVTGAPHPWPFQATDVRGVRGGAPQVQLDRRG
jgi:hypothetical protein